MIPENEETVAIRLAAADIISRLPQSVAHRKGNWIEESVLRDERTKEFLDKYERGLSDSLQNERRLAIARRKEFLTGDHGFNVPLMLRNVMTETLLSLDVPSEFPDHVTDQDTYTLTTAPEPRAVARSCWRVIPYDQGGGNASNKIRYGAKVYIVMTGVLDRPMFLASDIKSFSTVAKVSKQQAAFTTFQRDYRSVWQIEYPDLAYQMELEDHEILANTPIILRHCKTGSCLSSDPAHIIRNNFGIETEVACHAYRGTRDENKWLIQVEEN
ncbi:hypothetical protein HDU88_005954 [Geranomyces variabilis]|nr:hypothetical protein HDU88_005954 [Geranomyces variabilis]